MREEENNNLENQRWGFSDYYRSIKSCPGISKESALEQAFLHTSRVEFGKIIDTGYKVTNAERDLAIIHAKEDIALLCWRIENLKKIHFSIKITNFLLFSLIVISLLSLIK